MKTNKNDSFFPSFDILSLIFLTVTWFLCGLACIFSTVASTVVLIGTLHFWALLIVPITAPALATLGILCIRRADKYVDALTFK